MGTPPPVISVSHPRTASGSVMRYCATVSSRGPTSTEIPPWRCAAAKANSSVWSSPTTAGRPARERWLAHQLVERQPLVERGGPQFLNVGAPLHLQRAVGSGGDPVDQFDCGGLVLGGLAVVQRQAVALVLDPDARQRRSSLASTQRVSGAAARCRVGAVVFRCCP